MREKTTKRTLALCLSLALLLGMLPTAALADEGPPACHPTHEGCGYVEAVEGQPCKHKLGLHDESCGWAEATEGTPCDQDCAALDEAGAILHGSGCAYTPAVDGTPCGHAEHTGADGCGYVEAVTGTPCDHKCELCSTLDSGPTPGTSGQDDQKLDSNAALGRAAVESGTCGDPNVNDGADVTWELDGNGTFTISGTGAMEDYRLSGLRPWNSYSDKIQAVVIGDGVTTIGKVAFYNCAALERAEIGNSVETIGREAFARCSSLESITIPVSVKTIDYLAFSDCGLTSIAIPDSVETISQNPFAGCASLTTLTVDSGNRNFQSQDNLVLNKAGDTLVFAAGGLETAAIPEGVETIGSEAFSGSALTSVTIPASVRTIERSAFSRSALTSIAIMEGVETIERYAFSGSALTSVTIPASVETIKSEAFSNCAALTTVTVGSGVTTLGSGVFLNCSALTTVTVGSGVTALGNGAFADCTALESVTFKGKQAPTINSGVSPFANTPSDLVIYVPKGAEGYDGSGWPVDKVREAVTVTIPAIQGVTAPAIGAAPVTNITDTEQYTGMVAWSPDHNPFTADTEYTATITLTPKDGYTLDGVAANFFTVAGASAANDADSGTITAAFPALTYTISADTPLLNFGSVPVGYTTAPAAQTVTIKNTGNQAVTLNQPTATGTAYTVGALSKTGLTPNETATFTVQPKPGLAENSYSETVTVTNTLGKSVSVALSFSVTDKPTYAVTVHGGRGGGNYEAGAAVTITATVPGGQQFTTWTITPDVTFTSGGKNTETSTFTMPAQAVTATANFENKPSGNGGGSSGRDDTPSPTEQAVSKIDKAKDGDTVEVKLPSGGKLPNEILEAAAGKDVTLEIDAGKGLTWIINGKGIPTGKLADLNLKVDTKANTIPVTVINALSGEQKVMQLALSHNGPFGFPLTLRLDTGKENAGLFANLYYYDEAAKTLDYQTSAQIDKNGKADIPFAHASSYAVVIDAASHGKDNPNTGGDNPFTDVTETDWFFNAVMYVYHGGIMQGTSETTFSPNDGTTRAQLATILWRMEGSPAPTGGDPFSDVPGGTWYTDAVAWCAGAELVDGYGGGLFGPNDPITREQLAALLYRYAVYKGWDVSMGEDTNILSYADAFTVSEWAIPAVQWACGAGIMGGTTDNRLAPQEGATRAQIAAMLMRLLEKYAPGSTLPATGGTVTPNPGTGVLNAPQTGDGTGAGWLLLALPVSAAGAAVLSHRLRRKRREDEADELPDPTHA